VCPLEGKVGDGCKGEGKDGVEWVGLRRGRDSAVLCAVLKIF